MVTSFNFYYFQRYGRIPAPQIKLDALGQPAPTFANLTKGR